MSVLRRGSTGTEVRKLQGLLNAKLTPSPGLTVDGAFGRLTDTAVRKYQSLNGLTVDGVVGPQTWGSLEGAAAEEPAVVAPPTERTAQPWMTVAEQEMRNGVRGIAGSSDNPRIVQYHATTGHAQDDETAWCSSFANWCMIQAGHRGTNRANARSWLDWGQALDEPRYGCVTVLWRESRSSWKGHVAFFNSMSGSNLSLLGGNQSNSVRLSNYASSRVLGYRWPS